MEDNAVKKRQMLIKLIAAGYPHAQATEIAGFKSHKSAAQLLNNPHTLREIQAKELGLFYGHAVPLATRRLLEILSEDNIPKDIQIRAARTVFERADRLAEQLGFYKDDKKAPEGMAITDLENLVNSLKRQLMSPTIDHAAPEPGPSDSDIDGLLGI